MNISLIKRIIGLLLAFFPLFGCANAIIEKESSIYQELRKNNLPLIEINTINSEEPTCEYVDHPEGEVGHSIKNATKVPGRCIIWERNNCVYDSGDYLKGESGVTIRIRGNTSAYSEKKPYKLKLQKASDLLFRENAIYEDKDWLLIKDQAAFTNENEMNLNTLIGLKVNEMLGMQWTPRFKYVNLIVNGDYKGVYILIESIKRSKGRLNVKKDEGFIIEHDPYWWNEDFYFTTSWGGYYTLKYPDSEDITEDGLNYIKGCVEQAEGAMWADDMEPYIDVNSFASWLLGHDILGSLDGGGTNLFFTKQDKSTSTRLMMGNMWDFDGIMQTPNEWSACRLYSSVYYHLLIGQDSFMKVYISKWDELSGFLVDEIRSFLYNFALSDTGKALNEARYFEEKRWGTKYVSIEENIDNAINWFSNRKNWIDTEINALKPSSNIKNNGAPLKDSSYYYDLSGVKHKRGNSIRVTLMVKEGRVYFVK